MGRDVGKLESSLVICRILDTRCATVYPVDSGVCGFELFLNFRTNQSLFRVFCLNGDTVRTLGVPEIGMSDSGRECKCKNTFVI